MAVFRRLIRPETVLFIVLWLGFLLGGQSRLFRDPGTFWHMVVGDRICTTGEMIWTDPFTFTFHNQPWIAHQWLGECLMALAHRLGGLDTLLWLSATCLAALYTWIGVRLMRTGLHWSLTATLLGLALAASASHFHVRPHLATIVLLALTFAKLCDLEDRCIGIGSLIWLIPLFWLWANFHGGMLGGLATFAFVLLGWTVGPLLQLQSPIESKRSFLGLLLLWLICAATSLINPYGLTMPKTWLAIMDSPILPQIIQEHAPPDFATPVGWSILAFAAVYLFVLFGVFPQKPRVTWLLPLVWLLLSLMRVRHAPLFGVTALIAMAAMFPHTRWARRLERSGSDLYVPAKPESEPPSDSRPVSENPSDSRPMSEPPSDSRPQPETSGDLRWLIPLLLVCGGLILQVLDVRIPVIGRGWVKLDPTIWPVDLLEPLRQREYREADGTPIFNEYLHGGFLIYHTPGFRVFVDDRCELFGDEWLAAYAAAQQRDLDRKMVEWREHYGDFQFALTIHDSPFDRYFRGRKHEWRIVQETPSATLFEQIP